MNEINGSYETHEYLPGSIPNAEVRGWQEMPGGWRFANHTTVASEKLPFIEKHENGYKIGIISINEKKKAYSQVVYGSLDLAAEEAEKLVGENIDGLSFEIYNKESIDHTNIESET